MESKLLNFPDAMRLAQIVTKYIDTVSIQEMTGEEFAYELFSKMSEDEIIEISKLLRVDIKEVEPNLVIVSCVEVMIKNHLLDLLVTYKQLGFGK